MLLPKRQISHLCKNRNLSLQTQAYSTKQLMPVLGNEVRKGVILRLLRRLIKAKKLCKKCIKYSKSLKDLPSKAHGKHLSHVPDST
jgi:hypothetical protein